MSRNSPDERSPECSDVIFPRFLPRSPVLASPESWPGRPGRPPRTRHRVAPPAGGAAATPARRGGARGRVAGGRGGGNSRSDDYGKFWAGGTVTAVDVSAGTV